MSRDIARCSAMLKSSCRRLAAYHCFFLATVDDLRYACSSRGQQENRVIDFFVFTFRRDGSELIDAQLRRCANNFAKRSPMTLYGLEIITVHCLQMEIYNWVDRVLRRKKYMDVSMR